MEAKPENVDGKIIQKHTFTHELNWGYIAISAAVLVLAYVVYSAFYDQDDNEDGGV